MLKKRLLGALCALALIACMIPSAYAYTATSPATSSPWWGLVVTSTGSDVNIRSGPGTSYSVVESISSYSHIEIVGTSGDWYKVQYSSYGYTGYIKGEYLQVSSSHSYFVTTRDTSLVTTTRTVPSSTALPWVNQDEARYIWTVWGCLEGGVVFADARY